jgi:KipI family sensor histidine kinase inhibitor
MTSPSVSWLSDKAVLVQDVPPQQLATFAQAMSSRIPGARIRRGLDSLLVSYAEPSLHLLDEVTAFVTEVPVVGYNQTAATPAVHRILVNYGGEDLSEAAKALEVSPQCLVQMHCETTWSVQMIGFAPGFPYLAPLNHVDSFDIARRATPRAQVPAGSVGLAAGLSCIYPSAMPGGWWLIGVTDVVLFDPTLDSPALLHAGDVVRFEERP